MYRVISVIIEIIVYKKCIKIVYKKIRRGLIVSLSIFLFKYWFFEGGGFLKNYYDVIYFFFVIEIGIS